MLFFLQAPNGSLIYLLHNKQYTVGRKLCDILINDDQSISRKHAVLNVKNDTVTIQDCGSRYDTYIDKIKIDSDVEVPLRKGNVVQFGRMTSIYTFETVNIITTTSSIKSDQKVKLRNNINFLGGSVLPNWAAECTHVTVEEIMLTAKVLCAIIHGIPIVNLKYWDDYVNSVEQNLSPPDASKYLPNCCEMILSKNISLQYKEERKELFRNKVFVFSSKGEKAKLVEMIKLAGGEAISWDVTPLTQATVNNSSKEYVILQGGESGDQKSNSTLLDFITYYNQLGKRTIPLQEIALAIVKCSCEKDCNPNFDRKGTVLASSTRSQFPVYTENVLALPTQTQNAEASGNIKTELIVLQSIEDDLDIVTVDKIELSEEPIKADDTHEMSEIPSSIKRENESPEDNAPKRIKIETPSFIFKKPIQKQQNTTNDIIEIKPQPVQEKAESSGTALFAFRKNRRGNENTNSSSTNDVSNPFARKRKMVECDSSENPPKRPSNDSSSAASFFSSTPRATSSSSVINPFANTFKSRNSARSSNNVSQDSSAFKSKNKKSKAAVFNETANSLQIDSCDITVIDSHLTKSYGWISKSENSMTNKNATVNGNTSVVDEELARYIDSFKNTVIISEEKLKVHRRSTIIGNNNDSTVTNNNNVRNFKKFKKVQPLKVQTTIISERSYVDIICNHNCAVEAVQGDSDHDSDDAIEPLIPAPKRRGKRYEF